MDSEIDTEQVKDQIINAADERFRVYGYNKTTMAEIAKDCGMSAANLYRYFDNKLDICATIASRCLQDDENKLRAILNRKDLSAPDKLRAYVADTLKYTYEQWSQKPRITELVQAVIQEIPSLVDQCRQNRRNIVMSILLEGNQNGEFDVYDLEKTAETLLIAIISFDVPFFLHLYPFEIFKEKAANMAELLINGVRKC